MSNETPRYYFDYAAATPIHESVTQAMRASEKLVGNPASLHAEGRAARKALDDARAEVAKVLACQSNEIVFTSGSTESDNLAIFGSVIAASVEQGEVLTLATEHSAVRAPMSVLRANGMSVKDISLDQHGRINLREFESSLTDKTVLISVAYATSEIGVLQPLNEIGKLIRAVRSNRLKKGIKTPIIFHSDAAAVAGLKALHVDRLGVDLMTLGSAKIYGPPGIGALYVRKGTPLVPQLVGGGQELSRRAGTEPVRLAIGFATALALAEAQRKDEYKRLTDLRNQLWGELKDISDIILNSPLDKSLPNTLNISFPGTDGEDLVLKLDAKGFAVATGAACAESTQEPSHVLLGIGRSRSEAQGSLRLTLGRDTSVIAVKKLALAIQEIH